MTEPEFAGRYRLERRLGSGGMSTVQLAFDTRLERYVAVKLLAEHLAEDPTFVSRFQREAMAAARLIHPNIVQVFDSGLDQRSGQHYIVMEYIEGQSCAEILREHGWLGVEDTMGIILGSCEGLDYAHRKGVVHRDVKPGNLLRADDGRVKLADFGIAKATEQSSITQTGSVLGTAAYLAPEQGRGEEAGPPADIYALGVVTYQLLSGRLPFEGASLTELALKQQQERPPRLDELVAGVTPELADAVGIALRLDPGQRFKTALEMAHALENGVAGIAPGSVSPAVAAAAEGASTSATSVLGGDESATRVVRATPAPAVAPPRQPRPGPPRRAAPAAAPAARPRPPSRAGRTLALLVALAAVGALIAALVLSGGGPKKTVTVTTIGKSDVSTIVNDLSSLVDSNTQ
ncbi:MAG: eukaryotic-like serine/threonine-protein kinase [Solirubrobacteraceae bacterium]|nr:eukaryotic-like serine/threonine-protein kinase [Solirubrobacteraceae bacterium]